LRGRDSYARVTHRRRQRDGVEHRADAEVRELQRPKAVRADRSNDGDVIVKMRGSMEPIPSIPPRSIATSNVPFDQVLNTLLENTRRVATRYDKTADSFLVFLQLSSIKSSPRGPQ
jgi:hypothetical protein